MKIPPLLKPTITKPLKKVSFCLNSYSDIKHIYYLFSLSTTERSNAFYISSVTPNLYFIAVNGNGASYKTDSDSLNWRHICVTWDSDTGVFQFWFNGKIYPRKVFAKGSSFNRVTNIVMGRLYGAPEAQKSFVGEISDVHMWDFVLTPSDIQKVISGDRYGNVISWKSLVYEKKGEVLLQPKLQCKCWGSVSSVCTPCY
ncbi:C-reactive protein-like [Rana temporaria]|uniref:C-reactive protein-like n=1 Tax=Rana temporaria TaxID=8407 RepID=UPI001AAC95EE|nr:C-reactive protein-like [Rana temporaria]